MTIEPRVRSDNPDLHAAAYHEAGHAVAAVRQRLPLNSVDVTYVVGQRFGACDFDYEGATSDVRALCLLAAGAAERRYTGSHRAMDAGDVDRVGLLFKNSHLDPEIPYLQRQAGADTERQRVVNEWYTKAEQFVDREWEWIDRVARALTRRKQLTGAEVKTLCAHPVVHVDPLTPVQAFTAARDRMRSAPLTLTTDDFAHLESVDPSVAIQARQLRQVAESDAQRRQAALNTKSSIESAPAPLDPKAAIEALDRQKGRIHTIEDWRALGTKSAAAYTDDDLTLIRYFDGEPHADEARARRAKALAPPLPPATVTKRATRTTQEAVPTITRDASDPKKLKFRGFDAYTKNLFQNVLVPAFDFHLNDLIKEIADIFGKQKARIADLEARLKTMEDLDTRVKTMEARPELKYCGSWRSGESYSEGSLVTHRGGMWYALQSNPSIPGTADSGWQLSVKSGGAA